ncbi:lysophospholipid acyltransferase family protein [Amycolatopsis nigrescens]|uniref:lysophospholipid acyltransferase family protein n=1 Tax=Amycolatopsis nigrescens TaxID=381445 RepID=UPI000477D4D3|nr:lysophospholipid acyltransferase family protein [Amycolatopsis nigrescens]
MLHLMVRYALAPLAKAIYRPTVHGAELVPLDEPIILASNHRAAVDTALTAIVTPRPVSFLGKAEYFTGKGLKGRFMASLLSGLGYVPVQRGNAAAGLAALDSARKVLEAGGAFGIYPEGTRSLDGRLHRGHTGVGALALTTRSRVVPVAITGTEQVQPAGKRFPRRAKVTVRFGEPLDFSHYDGLENSSMARRAVTDHVMYAILELSEQEYVDKYHKRPDEKSA